MAFSQGVLVVTSFTRWAGFILGKNSEPTAPWRCLICSPSPVQIEIDDADDGLTAFNLSAAIIPDPPGAPPTGAIVAVVPMPLPFIGFGTFATFAHNLPDRYIGQIYQYYNIGGFGVYVLIMGQEGQLFAALQAELSIIKPGTV